MSLSPPETRASLILRLPNAADVEAWDELVAIYGPLVYRLARRQGLQPADADDLVQEVFAAIARSVTRWLERTDRGSFRAWLLRIARNAAVNLLTRPTQRPMATGNEESARLLAELPAPESPLSNQFDWEYRRQVFRWAAERVRADVAPTTWQAFWLTHVEERPIADVASELGISIGNVYIGRSRVMSRLRVAVKQFAQPFEEPQ